MASLPRLQLGMWLVNVLTILLVLASIAPLFFLALTQTNKTINTTLKPEKVLIIGDSITSLSVDKNNHDNKGWWEYLLVGKSGMFKFSAQGGSGYITKGSRGNGTNFSERLSDIQAFKPTAVIIAGGYNDRNQKTAKQDITTYFTDLAGILEKIHTSPKNVYMFVPRPHGNRQSNSSIQSIVELVRSNSQRIGANYIEVGSYSETYDSIHPTSIGAKNIARQFTKKSNFDEWLNNKRTSTTKSNSTLIPNQYKILSN